ncbi:MULTISPECIES: DHH family phosphoesterase [unclassified Clostridium]|uniref:DHH family phosphoesterase n=2 Tax=Clostridium TaxID=1485 RepID=UPI0025BFA42C|nr:DHH family phosphoesterase [Clostridium sp.]MCI6693300.1 DHH family phosphoesterase [Clostridium sp.]MDY2631095.1 phosphoesterase [Clostridium sp.]MDY4251821.1 phosphoesterase [Clostridium sp.]
MRKFWESIYSPNYITGYNPFILKNMSKAIEHMVEAINNRKKIVIYGVPNVDGLCAISSLNLVLKYLNADIEYVICEEDSNLGITSKEIINNVSFLGGQLLITLGLDLKSDEEEKLCRDLGIDLIVLENKEVSNGRNYIYINPSQKGCNYRYKNLSISGITFKLMQAIAIYYNIKSINKYLDLILIGEQWAEVPLKGENGVILKEGRKFLINTNNYGLRAIMNYYNIIEMDDECILKIIKLITPTINAVTMMDNARIIIELLTTNKKDRAEQITKYLNKSKMTI